MEKNADAIRGKTSVRIVVGDKDGLHSRNRDYHDLLDKLKIGDEFHIIKDVGHAAGLLYDGLGDKNWQFYARAFAGLEKPAPKDDRQLVPRLDEGLGEIHLN